MILTTTLYEKNFRHVLNPGNWFFNVESGSITKKVLVVNNISSQEEFSGLKEQFKDQAIFIYTDEIYQEALDAFKCNLSKSEISYWYSIQYFCVLYFALKEGEKYVLNVGADCTVFSNNVDDFIKDSIGILQEDPSVLLTTIPWSPGDFTETGHHEQNIYNISKRHDSFWFSKVVSDQVFLTSPEKLLSVDFNITSDMHPFPGYGGNSFERRLCNYLISKDYYRAIYKKHHFHHKSF